MRHVNSLHQHRSAGRDGAVGGPEPVLQQIDASADLAWEETGMESGCEGSGSRLVSCIRPWRLVSFALISIVALASEPANADSSASPSRDRAQDTSTNSSGFASQNVCGGDFGMLQQAEDVVNDNRRPDGSEIYRCTKL
jgi:hypothetical protein